MAVTDWGAVLDLMQTDPCAAQREIRIVLLNLSSSGAVQEAEFRDRRVRFHPSDTTQLEKLLDEATEACVLKEGKIRHHAISLNGGRRCGRRF